MRLAAASCRACSGVLVAGLVFALATVDATATAAAPAAVGVLRVETADYPGVVVRVAPRLPPSLTPVAVPASAFGLLENGDRRDVSVAPVSTEGLEVVLLVDTSSSGDAATGGAVISAAAEFVLRMNEAPMALVGFGGESEVISPLTDDRAELVAALGTVRPGEASDLAGALPLALGSSPKKLVSGCSWCCQPPPAPEGPRRSRKRPPPSPPATSSSTPSTPALARGRPAPLTDSLPRHRGRR